MAGARREGRFSPFLWRDCVRATGAEDGYILALRFWDPAPAPFCAPSLPEWLPSPLGWLPLQPHPQVAMTLVTSLTQKRVCLVCTPMILLPLSPVLAPGSPQSDGRGEVQLSHQATAGGREDGRLPSADPSAQTCAFLKCSPVTPPASNTFLPITDFINRLQKSNPC